MDKSLQNNDDNIIKIFTQHVSFGHSNGWVQNLNDFKKIFLQRKWFIKRLDNWKYLNLRNIKTYPVSEEK
ncbi:hypothetical protein [uncultured Chryseobacterium sp.]|uniref:hypothetical protein n=1 Tax=uncultured Chryseobacterium sp. TaxID=259322 RepID=UPI0026031BB2|nr:hypothetical protein [uncultured Chryseobacterium sp.]